MHPHAQMVSMEIPFPMLQLPVHCQAVTLVPDFSDQFPRRRRACSSSFTSEITHTLPKISISYFSHHSRHHQPEHTSHCPSTIAALTAAAHSIFNRQAVKDNAPTCRISVRCPEHRHRVSGAGQSPVTFLVSCYVLKFPETSMVFPFWPFGPHVSVSTCVVPDYTCAYRTLVV